MRDPTLRYPPRLRAAIVDSEPATTPVPGQCSIAARRIAGHFESADDITFTGRADNEMICRVLSTPDIAVDSCAGSPHRDLSTETKIMEYMFFSLPSSPSICSRHTDRGAMWFVMRGSATSQTSLA